MMTDPCDDKSEETAADRKAWEPLGFEKIDLAKAEAAFSNSGADHSFYS